MWRSAATLASMYASSRVRCVGVGNRQLDGFDSYFQHIPRLSALNIDWPCQNVPARPFVIHLLINVAQGLFDLIGRDACPFEPGRAGGDECLHFNRLARFDAQRRRRAGIVVAPRDCLWRGLQFIDLGCLTRRISLLTLSLKRNQREGTGGEEQESLHHLSFSYESRIEGHRACQGHQGPWVIPYFKVNHVGRRSYYKTSGPISTIFIE
jgi:hypothetical protein